MNMLLQIWPGIVIIYDVVINSGHGMLLLIICSLYNYNSSAVCNNLFSYMYSKSHFARYSFKTTWLIIVFRNLPKSHFSCNWLTQATTKLLQYLNEYRPINIAHYCLFKCLLVFKSILRAISGCQYDFSNPCIL